MESLFFGRSGGSAGMNMLAPMAANGAGVDGVDSTDPVGFDMSDFPVLVNRVSNMSLGSSGGVPPHPPARPPRDHHRTLLCAYAQPTRIGACRLARHALT